MTKKFFWALFLLTICLYFGFLNLVTWNSNSSKKEESGLFSDISKIREHDHTNPLDISSILKKYIPVGTARQDTISYLRKNGFELYPQQNSKELLAIKRNDNSRSPSWISFFSMGKFKYQISIKFDNNKVQDLQGELIYQSL
jgi:hypothetical protein